LTKNSAIEIVAKETGVTKVVPIKQIQHLAGQRQLCLLEKERLAQPDIRSAVIG